MTSRSKKIGISLPNICIAATAMLLFIGCAVKNKPIAPKTAIPMEYIIGCGDVLDVHVWKDAELSQHVLVLPDGTITVPLIGKVIAKGRTVTMLTEMLNLKISRFIPDPNLSVRVSQANSMAIYIIGKVNRPGRFVLESNITVMQALSLAGGLNPYAKENRIKIFRRINGKDYTYPFKYKSVANGKHLEQNIRLLKGDIVLVP